MSEQNNFLVYTLCDSDGQSTAQLVRTALDQFPNLNYEIRSISFVLTLDELNKWLSKIIQTDGNVLIFYSFLNLEFTEAIKNSADELSIKSYNVLEPLVEQIAQANQTKPVGDIKVAKELNEKYFDRISAIDFAVINDDGKNPVGFLDADLVILGVSRTSKTPLSIYLANQNYKVANLPLLPEAEIPKEIWEVDRNKIIGLTSDLDILLKIRKERLESYGIDTDTPYSCKERVQKELDFAHGLYEQLGCKIINVSSRSIEETASLIINHLNSN